MAGSLRGSNEMRQKLKLFRASFPRKVGGALRVETEIETTECKKRCPVYVGPVGPGLPIPGLLRNSIEALGPFFEGNRIHCLITAGGLAGAYAIPQHENLDWFHEVGQAKYIESVVFESRNYIASRVARRLKLSF